MTADAHPSAPHGPECSPQTARATPILFGFGLAYLGAIFALRYIPMPPAAKIAVALVPAPIFGWYIWRWMQAVRGQDELQRLITLEALAFAYPVSLLLILTLGLIEMTGLMKRDLLTYLQLWPLVFWFYFIGLIIARRRYA